MNYHNVSVQIIDLLRKNDLWFETFEHEPVRTSEDAAKIRHGYSLHQGAKTLIMQIKISNVGRKFVMLVVPGDLQFDNVKVKELFGAKEIRFATETEVATLTNGVLPGGIPPFGNLFGLEVIVDPRLFENEKIIFNAGDRRISIGMKSADYRKLVEPQVVSVTK
jgi:prolyl-tRNA editing enzyme YbaK/EbsC (Cys-tRNA(Pro) deacylase)